MPRQHTDNLTLAKINASRVCQRVEKSETRAGKNSSRGLLLLQHFEDLRANSSKIWHRLRRTCACLSLIPSHFVCPFQVLLGEVSAGLSTTQVVVKELKASASVQDQMQFLEEVQPYR